MKKIAETAFRTENTMPRADSLFGLVLIGVTSYTYPTKGVGQELVVCLGRTTVVCRWSSCH